VLTSRSGLQSFLLFVSFPILLRASFAPRMSHSVALEPSATLTAHSSALLDLFPEDNAHTGLRHGVAAGGAATAYGRTDCPQPAACVAVIAVPSKSPASQIQCLRLLAVHCCATLHCPSCACTACAVTEDWWLDEGGGGQGLAREGTPTLLEMLTFSRDRYGPMHSCGVVWIVAPRLRCTCAAVALIRGVFGWAVVASVHGTRVLTCHSTNICVSSLS
jgi:hypothetical protein